MRPDSQHAQMHLQPVGERGFAAGGRAKDHHHARAAPDDFIGDARDGFIVQGLVYTDELPHAPLLNHAVHVHGVLRAQDAAPALRGNELAQEFAALHIGRGLFRRVGRGRHQHHAGKMRLNGKGANHARGGQHHSVKVLAQRADAVHGDPFLRTVAQKLRLVRPALFFKIGDGLLARPAFLLEGQILLHQLAHVLLDGAGHLVIHISIGQAHVQAVAHRVEHAHPAAGVQPLQAQQKQKPERTLVYAPALLVAVGKRHKAGIGLQPLVKLQAFAAPHHAQRFPRLRGGQKRLQRLANADSGVKRTGPLRHGNPNRPVLLHARCTSHHASSKGILLINAPVKSSTSTWS